MVPRIARLGAGLLLTATVMSAIVAAASALAFDQDAGSHQDPYVRRAVIDKLTDQMAIAALATEDRMPAVRRAAARTVTEPAVLAKLAVEANDPNVRWIATKRLRDQEVLKRVALKDTNPEVSQAAWEALPDATLYQFAVDITADDQIRFAAIGALKDETQLVRVVFNADDQRFRPSRFKALAIGRITDNSLLAKIVSSSCGWRQVSVMDDEHRAVCEKGRERITDQAVLYRLALEDPDPYVRLRVVQNLTDRTALASLAEREKNTYIGKAAAEKLMKLAKVPANETENPLDPREAVRKLTDQTLLGKAAVEEEDPNIRMAAILRLYDQNYLAKAAVEERDPSIRYLALERLNDQTVLAGVVTNDTHSKLRRFALARINNKIILDDLAVDTRDKAVRLAAEVRLQDTSLADLCGANTGGRPALATAMGVFLLFDRQESLSSCVESICLMAIRQGEEARIRDLIELLDLYGTRSLAEAYINCGHNRLAVAGRYWAEDHRYTTLHYPASGSNLVRWGKAK
jgi:hypothetical protein